MWIINSIYVTLLLGKEKKGKQSFLIDFGVGQWYSAPSSASA